MKLIDLRRELESRSLSPRGLRSQLIARLTKSMKTEQEQEKDDEEKKVEEAEQMVLEEVAKEEVSKPEDSKETEKLSKEEEEKKRKDEREKAIQERRYLLPESPAIIVHPSATAKGGKFDCTVMSLSLLLDYRPEDNKEHSFEVSLFAELFNEMLMRDLGYCIYKALAMAPEKKEEKKEDKKKGDSHEKDTSGKEVTKEPTIKKQKLDESVSDNKKDKESDNKKDKEKAKDKKDGKGKGKSEKEVESEEAVTAGEGGGDKEEEEGDGGAEAEDMEDDASEEEAEEQEDKKPDLKKLKERLSKERSRKRIKRVTIDRQLLLAFVYFDQNHTGHLLDKDVEEILHTTGLQLSRAQVRKLAQKVSVRDAIHYRKLTDQDLDKVGTEGEDVTKTTSNEAVYDGNLGLLQSTRRKLSVDEADPKSSSVLRSSPAKQQSGMVSYRGAMLDIKSILQQLDKSEKTRAQMEVRCQTAAKEIGDLKSKYTKSEEKKEKAESEMGRLQSQLDDKAADTVLLKTQNDGFKEVLSKAKTMFKSLEDDIEKAETPVVLNTVKKEK